LPLLVPPSYWSAQIHVVEDLRAERVEVGGLDGVELGEGRVQIAVDGHQVPTAEVERSAAGRSGVQMQRDAGLPVRVVGLRSGGEDRHDPAQISCQRETARADSFGAHVVHFDE